MKRTVDNLGMIFSKINILLALSFLLFPIIVSIIMSFDGRSYLGLFPPPEYSFRWYENFFSDTYYLQGLKTSLIIAVIATVISTTFGVSAAIGLDRYQGRGKQVLEALFLSPLVVPAVVIGFAILIFGNLLWRLICEAWILFFRIHESLVSIEHNTSGGEVTAES